MVGVIRSAGVNGGGDGMYKGMKELFNIIDKLGIGKGYGRLGGQGFYHSLVVGNKRYCIVITVHGIYQLKNPYDFRLMILHGHHQH